MDENLVTQVEEQAVPSMDDTISNAWNEIRSRGQVERDESGKFATNKEVVVEKQQTEQQTEAVAETQQVQTEQVEQVQQEVQSIKPPSSWKKEAQAKFATLPPDIQAEVMRRETDMHNGIAQYKQNAEKAQAYERAFQPYLPTIQKLGIAPEVAVSELMKVDHNLRYGSPAQKVAIVQDIIKQYGIDPKWFDQAQTNADPQIGYLQNELQAMKAQQAEWQRQQKEMVESQQTQVLNSTIEDFAKSHEHFELVRDRMADLIQGAAASGKNMTMKDAYEQAIWAEPTVRSSILAKQQEEERAKQDAKAKEAKKASSVNVARKGTLPAQKPLGTMEDTIRAAAKELGLA